ncbi:hypothetical protein [Bacillus weihaiensis]|uniref:hypothetical protein n=1 Tax=Bacillus weihaiensis TaxID=1547283 RepID=UPI002355A1AF|nr:hypothetical protein [Bacillus weihaiensis]
MFSELNAKLAEVEGKVRKKRKYHVQLQDFQRELKGINDRISQLEEEWHLEKGDVEKLESITITNLFATLTGTKDERLSKEKSELLEARHKLDEARKTKKEIQESMEELYQKLDSFSQVEEYHLQLLNEKEHLIKSGTSPEAFKLFDLSEQEGKRQALKTEMEEAIQEGEQLIATLHQAKASLEKANNWGTWDMLGGGMVSGIVKHQHLDEAETYLHQAQREMRQFQKELLDLRQEVKLEIDISSMLRFADFFFDGFIADYMVQGKIQQSLDQVRSESRKAQDIVMSLKEQVRQTEQDLARILKAKRDLVEGL